jgi:hypothetical protein
VSALGGETSGAKAPGVPSVLLGPGVEDAGLAAMLADLVRQNLAQDPRKRADFERLDGAVVIEARDAEVAVTLMFSRDGLTVEAGARAAPRVRIAADSQTILALAQVKIVAGLPMVFDVQGRALVKELLRGSVRITPLAGNIGMLLRLTRLLSVRR